MPRASFFTNGAAGVLYNSALLGYGLDGSTEELNPIHHELKFDVSGTSIGGIADVQILNEDCVISLALTALQTSVLSQAITNSRGGAAAGTMPQSGILLGAGGFLKPLTIQSPLGGKPVTYPTVYLISPLRIPRATVSSVISVQFKSIAYSGGKDSLAGVPLYSEGF